MSGEASDGSQGATQGEDAQGPGTAAPAPDPSVAWGEDATSGRRFVRWNAVTLVLGVAACAGGVAALRAAPPAPWDPVGLAPPERWAAPEVARYAASEPGVARLTRTTRAAGASAELRTHATWEGERAARVDCSFAAADPRRVREVRAVGPSDLTVTRLTSTGAGWLLTRLPEGPAVAQRRRLVAGTPEDALPLLVRLVDWEATPELTLTLLPSLLAEAVEGIPAARLRAAGRERVEVPAGAFESVRVDVEVAGERRSQFWVGLGQGRPLVRFADPTGAYALVTVER